eukprot:scaffold121210_cov19-Tisochrysis_lutea.AAC.1
MQNVVLYVGSAADRQICQKTEFYYPSASLPGGGRGGRRGHPLKFDALLISYETLLKEQSMLSRQTHNGAWCRALHAWLRWESWHRVPRKEWKQSVCQWPCYGYLSSGADASLEVISVLALCTCVATASQSAAPVSTARFAMGRFCEAVLTTSISWVLRDCSIAFAAGMFDEAHELNNLMCKSAASLLYHLKVGH